jgi:hypothetical protein
MLKWDFLLKWDKVDTFCWESSFPGKFYIFNLNVEIQTGTVQIWTERKKNLLCSIELIQFSISTMLITNASLTESVFAEGKRSSLLWKTFSGRLPIQDFHGGGSNNGQLGSPDGTLHHVPLWVSLVTYIINLWRSQMTTHTHTCYTLLNLWLALLY